MLMQRKAQSRGFSEHSLISARQKVGEGSTPCSQQSQLGSSGVDLPRTDSLPPHAFIS